MKSGNRKYMKQIDRFFLFFGTGFYSGFLKPAPGTWGTLTTFPLFFVILAGLKASGLSVDVTIWVHFLAWVLIAFAGVLFSMRSATLLKTSDPSQVVIDEISAYGFVLWWGMYRLYLNSVSTPTFADLAGMSGGFFSGVFTESDLIRSYLIPSFIFFRFFDIVKPWPIRILDKWCKKTKMGSLANGFGIMADDWLAAFFTILVLELIHKIA